MDRGGWPATVRVVAESDMTERLTHMHRREGKFPFRDLKILVSNWT